MSILLEVGFKAVRDLKRDMLIRVDSELVTVDMVAGYSASARAVIYYKEPGELQVSVMPAILQVMVYKEEKMPTAIPAAEIRDALERVLDDYQKALNLMGGDDRRKRDHDVLRYHLYKM